MVTLEVTLRRQGEALSLGVYPDVKLETARDKCDAFRQQLAAGIDPGEARKAEK